MDPYIVYAKIADQGRIIAINSSEFLLDPTGWVEIDRGHGDRYHHAQGNYLEKPIITEGGAYRYKLIEGDVVECSAEEVGEQEAALLPAEDPTLDARVAELEEALELLLSGVTE